MKAFLTRPKKRKSSPEQSPTRDGSPTDEEPTEVKLALLSSLHPHIEQDTLLDVLLAHDGSVTKASQALTSSPTKKPGSGVIGYQKSLRHYALPAPTDSSATTDEAGNSSTSPSKKRLKSRKGTTLHLYDPADVAEHTPCTIIHNFLPAEDANDLLRELLEESQSYEKITFKLFDNVVSSPHTSSFYVDSSDEVRSQMMDYFYNGAKLTDVRRLTSQLARVKPIVQDLVNKEIQHRIKTRYPGGRKLKYQSPHAWVPNSAFVNCYSGGQESVGWHSDQLTYLGPRAIIGSVSLGVAREFRVRRIVPRDSENNLTDDADAEGQISIHLPHNSLLIMHAEMQEEWKHCVTPALSIDPHPLAGNRRINITYRDYRPCMHPNSTPKCQCGVPCVLRVVQKKKDNFGRYFWMCHAGNVPGKAGCSYFAWAEFDDDGRPVYKDRSKRAGTNRT